MMGTGDGETGRFADLWAEFPPYKRVCGVGIEPIIRDYFGRTAGGGRLKSQQSNG